MDDSRPREQYLADVTVFRQGDAGEAAYVVESGSVEVLSEGHARLAILGAGALFGEVALLDHLPRTATVRTLEPTVLIRIDRAHVKALLKRTDPVIRHLLTLLLERFRSQLPAGTEVGTPGSAHDQRAALSTLTLTRDLAYALDHGQLELHYQPLISFATRSLVGFEALVRWRHPTRGLTMPDDFIGLAEKTGLIHPLGSWVLRRAIADWAYLRRFCRSTLALGPFVSVNLSAAELADPQLDEDIRAQLCAHGMAPHELKVELTETVVIDDRATVGTVLAKLSALGVSIALDDFGTGYASLDYLKLLPVACIKIDKAFVQDMAASLRSHEIVHSAIQLAKSLDMVTVAEGVEDAETARHLGELGCHIAQGYYFAHPMPVHAVADWLANAQAAGKLMQ